MPTGCVFYAQASLNRFLLMTEYICSMHMRTQTNELCSCVESPRMLTEFCTSAQACAKK